MRQFSVKKGHHYCRFWWTKLFKPRWGHKKWSVTFEFKDDCYWSPPRNKDDYDINKLYGCGFGLFHHLNSWRLGWAPVFGKTNWFNLYAYVYDEQDGHISTLMGEVKADRQYTVTVEPKGDKYWFSCIDLGVLIDMPNVNKDCKLQFDLHPYAGGDNTAIQDMTLFIEYKPL